MTSQIVCRVTPRPRQIMLAETGERDLFGNIRREEIDLGLRRLRGAPRKLEETFRNDPCEFDMSLDVQLIRYLVLMKPSKLL